LWYKKIRRHRTLTTTTTTTTTPPPTEISPQKSPSVLTPDFELLRHWAVKSTQNTCNLHGSSYHWQRLMAMQAA
jgi:hypothetical protein